MSRLEFPGFLTTPLRPAFGSAADIRSAKIWAMRSARASNGCEECLGISPLLEGRMFRKLRTPIPPPHFEFVLLAGHPPRVRFPFPPLVVSPDLRLQHLLLFLLMPFR